MRSGALSDYWELTKPEVNFLIAISTGAAFCTGLPQVTRTFPVGTVSTDATGHGSGCERSRNSESTDRAALRRPNAAHRSPADRCWTNRTHPRPRFRNGVVGCWLPLFALAVRPAASVLALITLGAYLFLYTPLKRRTPMCTLVGAVPGAMPVLIGYVAGAGKLNSPAWLLYAILFLWQFPHFMAIAWMYREDYARAGYEVLPQGREKDQFVGWQSVLPALALVSVTFAPLALRHANPVFTVGTLLLSLSFLYFAAKLALIRSNGSARRLLLFSVVYLPLVFALQVLART